MPTHEIGHPLSVPVIPVCKVVCRPPIAARILLRGLLARPLVVMAWLLLASAWPVQAQQMPPASAEASQPPGERTPSLRSQALCPEVAKLAEAIALARDVGFSPEQTLQTMQQGPQLHDIQLLEQLVTYIYTTPETTPYMHSQHIQQECFTQNP